MRTSTVHDELSILVAALSDTARTARAQKQLHELIHGGGAATVLNLVIDRLLSSDGVRGTGARCAVARLLEEAMKVAGKDGLSALPRLVMLSGQALGDGSQTVRDSFVAALGSAARSVGSDASGRDLHTMLLRPLLKLLDGRTAPLQLGGAQALCEVVRALRPAQLRPSAAHLVTTLRRHLRAGSGAGPAGARPALLETVGQLLDAVPESCIHAGIDALLELVSISMQSAQASDWRERLASCSLLAALAALSWRPASFGHGLSVVQRQQLATSLRMLRVDKMTQVREAAAATLSSIEGPPLPSPRQPIAAAAAAAHGRCGDLSGGGAAVAVPSASAATVVSADSALDDIDDDDVQSTRAQAKVRADAEARTAARRSSIREQQPIAAAIAASTAAAASAAAAAPSAAAASTAAASVPPPLNAGIQ